MIQNNQKHLHQTFTNVHARSRAAKEHIYYFCDFCCLSTFFTIFCSSRRKARMILHTQDNVSYHILNISTLSVRISKHGHAVDILIGETPEFKGIRQTNRHLRDKGFNFQLTCCAQLCRKEHRRTLESRSSDACSSASTLSGVRPQHQIEELQCHRISVPLVTFSRIALEACRLECAPFSDARIINTGQTFIVRRVHHYMQTRQHTS